MVVNLSRIAPRVAQHDPNLLTSLCGQPPLFSMERQMLSWLALLTSLSLALAAIENAVLQIPAVAPLALVATIYLGLYYLVRFRQAPLIPVANVTFVLGLLDLTVGWLSNSGVDGSTTLFYIVPIVAALIVFKGRLRLFWLSLIIGHFFAMLGLQYWRPGLVTPYVSVDAQYLDMAFSFSMIVAFILGYVGLNSYNLDQRREVADALLRNILPGVIAEKLKYSPDEIVAQHHANASVLFADIVGFTPLSARLSPAELVDLLDTVFSHFDTLSETYGVEKIKTVGDCFMVAAGVPADRTDHACVLTRMAIEMQEYVARNELRGHKLALRIGINSGPVIAGVIGHKKFSYDLWGDAVNTASRMESQGRPGAIQVSQSTYELMKDSFICEPQGSIEVKGKGAMDVWYVVGANG